MRATDTEARRVKSMDRNMKPQPRRSFAGMLGILLLASLATGGCAPASTARAVQPAVSPEQEIVRELQLSADRWNAGDLEGFLRPYLESPTTTFVGSSGLIRGKDAIRGVYRDSYFRTGSPNQTLRFGSIEVRPLADDHALALGRYQLFDAAGARVAEGAFSLVFTRTADGWRIIHDHSS